MPTWLIVILSLTVGIPGGVFLAGYALRWMYQVDVTSAAVEIRLFGKFASGVVPFEDIDSVRKTRGLREALKASPTCFAAFRLKAAGGLRSPEGVVLTMKTDLRWTFPPGVSGRLLIFFPDDPDGFVRELERRLMASHGAA